ncbi:MAG: class I SAM-dependent methyltransferase [Acidobacteriota bacterium]
MGLLDRLGTHRPDAVVAPGPSAVAEDPVFATKALRKLLASLASSQSPVVLDLGPVVGSNVSFFGERFGCKILIEDIFADIDRHARAGTLAELPAFLKGRFSQKSGTVDAVLCWDLLDYLDKPSALALAGELSRVMRPDGVLLAFFGTAQSRDSHYTKYVVMDDVNLKHRPYPAARGRQAVLLNGDIIKLFSGLRVSDSFLMLNNMREILFRKPA